jgi:hypothetical protein
MWVRNLKQEQPFYALKSQPGSGAFWTKEPKEMETIVQGCHPNPTSVGVSFPCKQNLLACRNYKHKDRIYKRIRKHWIWGIGRLVSFPLFQTQITRGRDDGGNKQIYNISQLELSL